MAAVYYSLLNDETSKLVRGTAFQGFGQLIAALGEEYVPFDGPIVDQYNKAVLLSQNQDVLYHAAFNFPAYVKTYGADHWDLISKLYAKLVKQSDERIKKSLAHSVHELSRVLGDEIANAELVGVIVKYLNDPATRGIILLNLHSLLP